MRDWARERAERWGARTALVEADTGRTLSYADLDRRAQRLAELLHRRAGVGGADRVALLAHNRALTFELLFACARLGATLVPLNWRLAAAELSRIVAHCAPRAILHEPELGELAEAATTAAPEAASLLLAAPGAAAEPVLRRRAAASSPPGPLTPETAALVLYTSGTTGLPKGVVLPWRQLLTNAMSTTLACGLGPRDRCLTSLPLFHTGGLNCLSTPVLFRGGTVVLDRRFDAEGSLDLLERHRIRLTIGVPTMIERMVEAGLLERPLPALRALLVGGAPCPASLLDGAREAGLPLRQGYGSTEAGPNCFTLSPVDGPHRAGSVGQLMPMGDARLVDEGGIDVPEGEAGELLLRGPHVMTGYLHDPAHTAGAIDADGFFHTGDLLRRTPDGFYYVVGRRKEMFISGGENVYPAEVEAALGQHPAVRQAAVVGVSDPRWGQVGLAAIVLRMPIGEADLVAWLRTRLAGYKVPRRFAFVDALPVNATGKVRRDLLLHSQSSSASSTDTSSTNSSIGPCAGSE